MRLGDLPLADKIRFELPSARMGLGAADRPTGGALAVLDEDREEAAWETFSPEGSRTPRGHAWWYTESVQFRAEIRMAGAIASVDRGGTPSPAFLETLPAFDIEFLDMAVVATQFTNEPREETPEPGLIARPRNLPVTCATCQTQYLPCFDCTLMDERSDYRQRRQITMSPETIPLREPGDSFAVELRPNEILEARVLLDVTPQCIAPRRLPAGSSLTFFADAFLVEVRRGVDILIPAVFVHSGEWPQTGRRDVVPEAIDFPQTLTLVGPRPHLTWGEVKLPLAISVQELRAINAAPAISPVSALVPMSLYRLGRKNEIDTTKYKAPELFQPGRTDVRFSLHAEKIRGLLADRISDTYFTTAMRYGYDPRRFYEENERMLLLCPYCNGPIEKTTTDCPTCGMDARNDAPLEISNIELALTTREKCRTCVGPVMPGILVCPGCKSRQ